MSDMTEQIKKYKFKESLSSEFEIIDLASTFSKFNKIMTKPHRALFYTIIYIESGNGVQYIDFEPVNIIDNSIIFIPKDAVTVYDKNCNYKGFSILFTESFFCNEINDIVLLKNCIPFNDIYKRKQIILKDRTNLIYEFLKIMKLIFQEDSDSKLDQILRSTLRGFILYSEKIMKESDHIDLAYDENIQIINSFRSLIENKYKNEKNVNRYVERLNVNEKKLSRTTKTLLGKTPKEMIDERVILEAKRLLTYSDNSVKEIGFELGFDEPTNFIKFFKRKVLVSPLEFKQKNMK
ncbi:MAG: helix-turn-helix domain-containing protein [Candidatus Delongbacteria bacterium]|nr:helix-turn-helix domain-containing protein [Candidatus Delongbacteria bacterium]